MRTIKDCLDMGTDPYQLRTPIERAEAEGTLRRGPAAELRAAAARTGPNKEGVGVPALFGTTDELAFTARSTDPGWEGFTATLTVPEEIDVPGMRPLSRTRCTKLRRNEQQLSLANYFEQQENLDAARSMRPGWPTESR